MEFESMPKILLLIPVILVMAGMMFLVVHFFIGSTIDKFRESDINSSAEELISDSLNLSIVEPIKKCTTKNIIPAITKITGIRSNIFGILSNSIRKSSHPFSQVLSSL